MFLKLPSKSFLLGRKKYNGQFFRIRIFKLFTWSLRSRNFQREFPLNHMPVCSFNAALQDYLLSSVITNVNTFKPSLLPSMFFQASSLIFTVSFNHCFSLFLAFTFSIAQPNTASMVRKWVLGYLLHCQEQPSVVGLAAGAVPKVKRSR